MLAAFPVQIAVLTTSALLAGVIGVLAILRRGHWLTTLLFASAFAAMAALQAGTLRILLSQSEASAGVWADYVASVAFLAAWLWLALSVVLARPNPGQHVRKAAGYLMLALAGCVLMSLLAGSSAIVRDVAGNGPDTVIRLGALGKIGLMYLVLVMVAVLMNLERMLRTAPEGAQRRLRPMFIAFLVGVLGELLTVSGGLLYGRLRALWLVGSALPLCIAGTVTAVVLARRRLSEMTVPVGRPVFYYSSVSLTIAGAFLLTMAVLSKVLPVLTPEWKRGVSIGFYLLVGGGGLLLTLSPRANRALKRSIDRNFYANRYDYPREWERVSRALAPAARLDEVCRQIEGVVGAVFDVERIAIHLRERPAGAMRRVHGPANVAPVIDGANPLVRELERNPEPVVFRDLEKDLDLIPVAVENRPLIQALDAEVCAPLCVVGGLRGALWLPRKRSEEHYSHEDIELLGAMALQFAGALAATTTAEQSGEARALESIGRLSAYVVRDLEVQASALASVLEAARRRHAEPGRETLTTIERAVGALHGLTERVTALARPGVAQPQPTGVHALLEEAAVASGLHPGERNGVNFRMAVRGGDIAHVDRPMTLRLLVHLFTNARQALNGSGEIEVSAETGAGDRDGGLSIRVRDTGRGMSEDFIRTTLFRPFASTRPGALGLGLSQCKRIVEAHGGSVSVESRPGVGTTFKVHLPSPPSSVRVTPIPIDGRPAA